MRKAILFPVHGTVTMFYDSPVKYIAGRTRHEAIDIVTTDYAEVYAPFSGRVIHVEDGYTESKKTDYGNRVYIECVQDGVKYVASFAHLKKGILVSVNQEVRKGQIVGYTGRTGYRIPLSTIHTHYELEINGKRVDPLDENNYPNELTQEDMQEIEDLKKRVEELEKAVEKIREKKISKKKAKRLFKRK